MVSSSPSARLREVRAAIVGGPAVVEPRASRAAARSPVAANVIGCGRADDRVRVRAQPAEQLRRLVRVAVVSGDAGRDADRRGAFGGIRGTEQTVGQCRRGRAVSGAGQLSATCAVRPFGAGVDRGRYSRAARAASPRAAVACPARMPASRSSRSPCSASRTARSGDRADMSSCERSSAVSTSWWWALPTIWATAPCSSCRNSGLCDGSVRPLARDPIDQLARLRRRNPQGRGHVGGPPAPGSAT